MFHGGLRDDESVCDLTVGESGADQAEYLGFARAVSPSGSAALPGAASRSLNDFPASQHSAQAVAPEPTTLAFAQDRELTSVLLVRERGRAAGLALALSGFPGLASVGFPLYPDWGMRPLRGSASVIRRYGSLVG